jgi:glutamate formiminotransferase/formiminotetrahydrofolate cyclodeaminase
LSQDKYKAVHAEIHPHSSAFALLQQELYRLIEDDSRAYERLIDSFKLPKSTDEEKAARQLGIEAATRQATEVPMQTASVAVRVLESLAAIREGINPNAMSDLGVGAQMALAAAKGAIYNVRTNLSSMPDTDFKRSALSEAESLWQKASSLAADIEQYVLSKLG